MSTSKIEHVAQMVFIARVLAIAGLCFYIVEELQNCYIVEMETGASLFLILFAAISLLRAAFTGRATNLIWDFESKNSPLGFWLTVSFCSVVLVTVGLAPEQLLTVAGLLLGLFSAGFGILAVRLGKMQLSPQAPVIVRADSPREFWQNVCLFLAPVVLGSAVFLLDLYRTSR